MIKRNKKIEFLKAVIVVIVLFLLLVFISYFLSLSINNRQNSYFNFNINEYKVNNELDIETCELIDVVDGDTIKVKINNSEELVRLLNIDTPESVHPDMNKNTIEGKNATNFTKNILKDFKILYLTKDKNNRDKYGRLLRLVWLYEPINDSKEELENKCLNVILLKNKVADVVVYDDYRYYKKFTDIKNGK